MDCVYTVIFGFCHGSVGFVIMVTRTPPMRTPRRGLCFSIRLLFSCLGAPPLMKVWSNATHRRSRSQALACVLLIASSLAGCEFEGVPVPDAYPPGDLGAGAEDMPRADLSEVGADMKSGEVDMPGEDMKPPVDMEEVDMKPPAPDMPEEDMPGELDLGADMPDDVDMPEELDMGVEPDMMIPPGELGASCIEDRDCEDGRCEFFGGDGVCTVDCVSSCPGEGLFCVDGLCTPDDYCPISSPDGPGCDTCDKCALGASCTPGTPGQGETFICACDAGYVGDGYTCLDVDECADGSAQCDANATCFNTPGDFTCACNQGYIGDGTTCSLAPDTCSMCDANAACLDVAGNQSCVCNPGWDGNGFTCVDVDECANGAAQCSPLASCTNTPGGFDCSCDAGYVGDGVTCTDIDECQAGTDSCDPLASCTNTAGGHTCTCPFGVAGDGVTCTPYASCSEILQNNPGSPDGDYLIQTLKGAVTAYCDMTSDGGVGYTMLRVDDPGSLLADQQDYQATCAAFGMEVITPRTSEHMSSIVAWNSGPPNIVGVRPQAAGARGLSQWEGVCSGQPCGFYINGKENSFCRSVTGSLSSDNPGRWTDGSTPRSCQDYLEDAALAPLDGFYIIDVDGPGGESSFTTYCDMGLDAGGWSLAATTSDDGVSTWTWNRRNRWTTDRTTVGMISESNKDYKNIVVHDLPYRDLLFLHQPSGKWASYHDVGDGAVTFSDTLSNAPAPNCESTSGYLMSNGNLVTGGELCNTSLYFHPGDYDGIKARCENYGGIDLARDESTWGPAWSMSRDHSCPFDDPAYSSFGANHHEKNVEADGIGFGQALSLNTGADDAAQNYMQLFIRGDETIIPNGDNATGELLVLESGPSGAAGPACVFGSWDDSGDTVNEQGWVICGLD